MRIILSIFPIRAFQDNYIWLIDTNEGYIVVDPGDAQPVITKLGSVISKKLTILVTHHHFDHTGGVEKLKQQYGAEIIGPEKSPFKKLDKTVKKNDVFSLYNLKISVEAIPGHTLDHIYYLISDNGELHVFCGDTLFSGGCGRVFEGTYEQMYESLMKIRSLPKTALVYPAHEYTLSNLRFALAAESNNLDLHMHEKKCKELQSKNIPTLPSSIEQELLINPFLRVESKEIKDTLARIHGISCSSPIDVFRELRQWKDSF
ncbi:MAG: hydroxyacylglutathione hydrolase [Gammaproteobacteria bacterium]